MASAGNEYWEKHRVANPTDQSIEGRLEVMGDLADWLDARIN
jgi:hypothetical protein